MRWFALPSLLLSCVVFGGCGDSEESGRLPVDTGATSASGSSGASGLDTLSEEELRQRRQALELEIASLVADKSCSSDAECRFHPYGSKPCGGPDEYLVYSATTTNEALLIARVDAYNAIDRRWDQARGAVSDCAFVPEPTVECAASRCVAR